jgi:hypothetical protein
MVISGERLSADHIGAENFIKTFEMLINDNCFVPDQIYNIDETGLNYKMLPQKTLASNQEKSKSGIKVAKERVTVAACSNASRTHKLPLFVIGTSHKPKDFKRLKFIILSSLLSCTEVSLDGCNSFKRVVS